MATVQSIGLDASGEGMAPPAHGRIGAEAEGRASMRAGLIREQLRDYIVENYLFGSGTVEDEASLLDDGVLDSMGVLELVLFVEETFGVPVSEEEVVPEHFDSISAIASFVEHKWSDVRHDLAS